jgi:hypothetical protein
MSFPHPSRSICVSVFLAFEFCLLASVCAQPGDGSRSPGVNQRDPASQFPQAVPVETVVIPGPLRSFLRMAGISQKVSPDEVMPMLAHSISLQGYKGGTETEFLHLLDRYVHLAREVRTFSDASGRIHVAGCADAGRLIAVLGYRSRGTCGQRDFAFVTQDAERAFLTIDSGFPLTALEEALQKSQPFEYQFPASRVPIIYTEKDWMVLAASAKKPASDLLDALLHDRTLDRLYWALSRCDEETRAALKESLGLNKLLTLAPEFEMYGGEIRIHSGSVVLPPGSEKGWHDLVGESPGSPDSFVTHLLSRDHGWLAAYFDAVSRLNQMQQAHIVQEPRLKRLYSAYRSTMNKDAAYGIFPRNANLLILLSSIRWNAKGEPEIPGTQEFWQEVFSRKNIEDRERVKLVHCCDAPERTLEALVATSRYEFATGPTAIFVTLSAVNGARPVDRPLSNETQQLIASKFAQYNRWFPIFAEFPSLDDAAIKQFVTAADRTEAISNSALRSNALGAFQAEVGIWQILARQGQIPVEKQNSSWQRTMQPFSGISNSLQLFDASRTGLQTILTASSGRTSLSQDEMIDALAGPAQESPDGQRVHQELAERIRSVMDDQRLVSLDTLFGLYDGLTQMAHGAHVGDSLLSLAGNLKEFEMPRPIFTGGERSSWSPLVYTSRHAELQIRTNLTKVIQSAHTPAQFEAARGQLTPFLRDTLVGLNYAYYEPPGAAVLHSNPLLVRSHDFSSVSIQGIGNIWGDSILIGVGATAGGGAYLVGSLVNLPYALAATEGELISPKNVQALIWKEAVPDLLLDAILPRWWTSSRTELRAAALYQRAGEELLIASASNPELRSRAVEILADQMTPERLEWLHRSLERPETAAKAASGMLPSETYYLSVTFRALYPDQSSGLGQANRELSDLVRESPADTNPNRISADFGVPHSVLLMSNSRLLLNMKPPPAFGGYANRLLAQSWESNNLYWARLADEMGYPPVMLNVLVPALTRRMVVNIFASTIDDWPALFRAMQETGDEFRNGKITVVGVSTVALK